MKKAAYFLLITSFILITACKKKFCWECTTVEAGGGGNGQTETTICDQTEEEIQSRIGTTTSTDTTGTKPIQKIYTTTCRKQE